MTVVLMCRPTAFDVVYAINPWMEVNNKHNKTLALKQWQNLYDTYPKLGVKINLIEQGENVTDMVFTANAGVVRENTFIASNF
ncbi:arginine deiminase-related protein, partial [Francisella tularensis]|uniref:arginine deiminase-related protein n=1 Tax=Francisella tularensis TaxID=263 RepID=UPI002381AD06